MQIKDVKEFHVGDIVQCTTQDLGFRLFYRVTEVDGDRLLVLQCGRLSRDHTGLDTSGKAVRGLFEPIVPDTTNGDISQRTWPIWLPAKDLQILWRDTWVGD